jgi:hypothetical protein
MDSKHTHTINIDAYMEWLGKARVNKQTLINPQFTVKSARQVFVTINLDDDLFQQLNRSALMSCVIFSLTVRGYTCTSWTDTDDRVTADDTADGLTKEEFFEAIARVCAEYYHSADEDAGSANSAEVRCHESVSSIGSCTKGVLLRFVCRWLDLRTSSVVVEPARTFGVCAPAGHTAAGDPSER